MKLLQQRYLYSSAASVCPSVLVGLDVPMDLTVTASTDKAITLVWGVVQGPIDHYKVTCTSSSGVTTEVKPMLKNVQLALIESVQNLTTVTFCFS